MSDLDFDGIVVRGAREHNLKNISLTIPRNQITVITGLSGSGKSSLAFDTIYAEGQRRYVESLSAYARNFLDQLKKPEVDSITGLSPAIAIEQKTTSTNPRSTVGTVTEVYDYLRLLFAKVGTPICPTHKTSLTSQTPSQIAEDIMALPQGTPFNVLAPVVRMRKGEFGAEFEKWLKKGFVRARIDGEYIELTAARKLAKTKTHNIELVIDRLVMKPGIEKRLTEALHLAIQYAEGMILIENTKTRSEKLYSLHAVCPECGFSFPELEPRLFSFNNPKGACPTCDGLGYFAPVGEEVERVTEDGDDGDESDFDELALTTCTDCNGTRLRTEALHVLIDGQNIGALSQLGIQELVDFFKKVNWSDRELVITKKLIKQIEDRLLYLKNLGVGYLSLNRATRTLSGGESQRIRLATQLGSSLVGVLYVLDEPSIGLHPRDHRRLLDTLSALRDLGNTIVLVEHDEDTIRFADHVIDIGPRAGVIGGEILATGTPRDIENTTNSLTGQFLSGKLTVAHSKDRFQTNHSEWIRLKGACGNNLKNVDLKIPLNTFTCVTGVSGSGKSTLIIDTLFRHLSNHFNHSSLKVADFKGFEGINKLERVVNIDQRPIGRTPRSNPATYVGLFSQIRDLFAQLPDSRLRGYKPGRFSFNVKGGRCEACQGGGAIKVEMHFLADVYVQCEVCQGKRYNRETLNVKYRDKTIADVLGMSVREALEFFVNHKQIHRKLETLDQVGLDYLTLGQSSTTLSGGEAQRVKLSRELSKKGIERTLYILDEPTTGLHFEDVRKLIELLHLLVESNSTVVVIEHNLDVIRSADYVVDLGPEGGSGGGKIVAEGPPAAIKKVSQSLTGQFI